MGDSLGPGVPDSIRRPALQPGLNVGASKPSFWVEVQPVVGRRVSPRPGHKRPGYPGVNPRVCTPPGPGLRDAAAVGDLPLSGRRDPRSGPTVSSQLPLPSVPQLPIRPDGPLGHWRRGPGHRREAGHSIESRLRRGAGLIVPGPDECDGPGSGPAASSTASPAGIANPQAARPTAGTMTTTPAAQGLSPPAAAAVASSGTRRTRPRLRLSRSRCFGPAKQWGPVVPDHSGPARSQRRRCRGGLAPASGSGAASTPAAPSRRSGACERVRGGGERSGRPHRGGAAGRGGAAPASGSGAASAQSRASRRP